MVIDKCPPIDPHRIPNTPRPILVHAVKALVNRAVSPARRIGHKTMDVVSQPEQILTKRLNIRAVSAGYGIVRIALYKCDTCHNCRLGTGGERAIATLEVGKFTATPS